MPLLKLDRNIARDPPQEVELSSSLDIGTFPSGGVEAVGLRIDIRRGTA